MRSRTQTPTTRRSPPDWGDNREPKHLRHLEQLIDRESWNEHARRTTVDCRGRVSFGAMKRCCQRITGHGSVRTRNRHGLWIDQREGAAAALGTDPGPGQETPLGESASACTYVSVSSSLQLSMTPTGGKATYHRDRPAYPPAHQGSPKCPEWGTAPSAKSAAPRPRSTSTKATLLSSSASPPAAQPPLRTNSPFWPPPPPDEFDHHELRRDHVRQILAWTKLLAIGENKLRIAYM
jgi:hypothetical protein